MVIVKRLIVWLSVALVLAGCSTTASIQGPYKIFPSSKTQSLQAIAPTVVPSPATTKNYQYGKFTVVVDEDGSQKVEGGEFVPPPRIPVASKAEHVILVNYTTKELMYYRRMADGTYEPIIGYAVMTPHESVLPKEVARGRVLRIVEKPTWCPKVGGTVRQETPSLPGCMPHGHPLNAMGDWRFDMAWDAPGWELNKLHGVPGYSRGAFWTEKTHGCIRLTNDAIKHLIDLLGSSALKEGIEVIAFKGSKISEKALPKVGITAD